MLFTEMHLPGAFIIELEPIRDERGFFSRAWCRKEFEKHGLKGEMVQCNIAFNHARGTVRGMHYQVPPYAECKLVQCTKGAIYDVIIDVRKDSPTRKQWLGVELTAENRRMLYVPEGLAHGYQVLEDDTEILYQVTEFYARGAERGVRWDDPQFNIQWPLPVSLISEKDRNHEDFE